jgi:hypothetical protein
VHHTPTTVPAALAVGATPRKKLLSAASAGAANTAAAVLGDDHSLMVAEQPRSDVRNRHA